MAKFENKKDGLYIDNQKVIRAFESYSGWYWFATKHIEDTIYSGFVQGLEEEWGDFDVAELESLKPKVWELPQKTWEYSGRR